VLLRWRGRRYVICFVAALLDFLQCYGLTTVCGVGDMISNKTYSCVFSRAIRNLGRPMKGEKDCTAQECSRTIYAGGSYSYFGESRICMWSFLGGRREALTS